MQSTDDQTTSGGPTLEDRCAGCLVGLAVGDALGAPLEEIPNQPCSTTSTITEMIGGGWLKLMPGQVTDDTEMALCIAQSLAERRFDPADIAKRFMHWFYDSPIGTGSTTRAAMRRLRDGVPWYEAGYNAKGMTLTGNGSVMRCAPVAIFDHDDENALQAHSRIQSIITHPHPDCTESAGYVNTIIAGLLGGMGKEEAYAKGLASIDRHQPLHDRYSRLPPKELCGKTGEVKDTVESALACFLTTDDFEEAVVAAVNLRGDADTRGAVVGALAGAHYGEQAIPDRWKLALNDRHGTPIYRSLKDTSYAILERRNTRPSPMGWNR
jgi:ADP-ribosyl-[dinitrogen reductase] hydrolase